MDKSLSVSLDVSSRKCGECTECCYVAQVVEEGKLDKKACVKCPFQGKGCLIFDKPERPAVCSSFQCGWLRGAGKEGDRPDQSGVMVSVNEGNGGTWIFAMDLVKNAHKTTGKNIVVAMANKYNLPVIVVDYDNLEKGMGDFVIIKESLVPRSSQIMGDFLGNLTDDMKIYKLIAH